MDWLNEIRSFSKLDPHSARLPLPEREAAEAVARFNRAVGSLRSDNSDIAAIELKKLCATVPSFGQAFLLLGCVLMASGNPVSARRTFQKAVDAVLSDDLRTRLASYAEAAAVHSTPTSVSEESDETRAADMRAALLDAKAMNRLVRPSREGRRKVRMARSQERRTVLSSPKGDAPQAGPPDIRPALKPSPRAVTPGRTVSRIPSIRFLRGAAIVLLAAAMIALVGIGLPALIDAWPSPTAGATPSPTPDAQARLAWILEAIDELRKSGKPVSTELRALLEAFNAEFPEAAISIPPDPTPTAPLPTPTPTVPTDADVLLAASKDVAAAETKIASEDFMGAADLLLLAQAALSPIPGTTVADGLPETAAQLLGRVGTLLDGIDRKACEEYRKKGLALFNQGDFAGALVPFLKAYTILPTYYGGGVAYYTGRCFEELGRKIEAAACFRFVIDRYPEKDIADYSRAHLDRLGL